MLTDYIQLLRGPLQTADVTGQIFWDPRMSANRHRFSGPDVQDVGCGLTWNPENTPSGVKRNELIRKFRIPADNTPCCRAVAPQSSSRTLPKPLFPLRPRSLEAEREADLASRWKQLVDLYAQQVDQWIGCGSSSWSA